MKVNRNREIRKLANGRYQYTEYSTLSGRALRVLMTGYAGATREDFETMVKGYVQAEKERAVTL